VNQAASAEHGQRPLHLVPVEKGEKSEVSLICFATYTSVFALDGGWGFFNLLSWETLRHNTRCIYHLHRHYSIPHFTHAEKLCVLHGCLKK
jgi:hypothetical protein